MKSKKRKLQPIDYITAIKNADGFLVEAAEKLSVSYQAVQFAIKNWPEVGEVYTTVIENRLDMAEKGLSKAIEKDKSWAIQFLLRYKGRNRGFAEKQIVEATNVNKNEIDLSNLSDKDLKSIQATIKNANTKPKSD